MAWPTYIHVFCDIHMLLHFFHRPSPKSVNSPLKKLQLSYVSHLQLPGSLALGGHLTQRFQWGDLQSPVAMKDFLNHIIWWLGYIRYVVLVCWKSLSERWKVKRLIRLPRFGSSDLFQIRLRINLGEATGKPWKGIPPNLEGISHPRIHPWMLLQHLKKPGFSIFSPNRQPKKTPPENSHKLEDNETLENKRKNRQIHQGGFQSV